MKKILNSVYLWMFVILGIAFLSSCTNNNDMPHEIRGREVIDGHTYVQVFLNPTTSVIHDPDCESIDLDRKLDSLNRQ